MTQRISLEINEQTLPSIEQITEGIPGGFFIYHADDKKEIIKENVRERFNYKRIRKSI